MTSGLSNVEEGLANEEGLPEDPVGQPIANSAAKRRTDANQLSVISQKYDRGDKGYLDPVEQQLRGIDKSNRGFVTLDNVYDMMEKQMNMQKQMVTMRRLIIGLVAFTVVLALANMGTAFAAASLAKDTSIDANGNFVPKGGGDAVATRAAGITVKIEPIEDGDGRRLTEALTKACSASENYKPSDESVCKKDYWADGATYRMMQFADFKSAKKSCIDGENVYLEESSEFNFQETKESTGTYKLCATNKRWGGSFTMSYEDEELTIRYMCTWDGSTSFVVFTKVE